MSEMCQTCKDKSVDELIRDLEEIKTELKDMDDDQFIKEIDYMLNDRLMIYDAGRQLRSAEQQKRTAREIFLIHELARRCQLEVDLLKSD